jgi:SAM-dependent methyltransferase
MVHLEIQFSEQMTSQPNAFAQTADFEFAALNEARNYRHALLRDFQTRLHGNVLEVGAGVGQMTCELLKLPAIERLYSIEPDAGYCTRIREQLPHVNLLQGTVDDLKAAISWDAILSINVLEHIELDADELATYYRLLKPARGALCLFVPARPEIYAPIDKDFGHFRRYTRADLRKKLEHAGFRVYQLRYYNLVGYFAWWANFCLLKKRSFDVAAVRLFDRAIFPTVHALESRICPPPIGQSLMVVAEAR